MTLATLVRPTTPSTTNAYPVALWVLLGGQLVVRAFGFAYPFLAYHVAGRGYGASAVGAVLAAFGIGWAVGQLVCGWLVDRVGARVTLVGSMLVAAVALPVLAQAHGLPTLLVGAVVAGVVFDAPRPVLSAAITDLVPDPARRARIDAWRFGWVVNLGAAVSGGLGGLLADRVGIPVLYWVNGVVCAAFGVLAYVVLAGGAQPSVSTFSGWRQALADRRLGLLVASSVTTLTAPMGVFAAMPMLMVARGLEAGAYGVVQMAGAVAVVALTPAVTSWLSPRLLDRSRLDLLAAGAIWMTVCMAACALAPNTVAFGVAAAACAPGEIVWFVVVAGVVHRIAPHAHRGSYHGIWGSTLAAAAVISPLLAGCALDHGGQLLVGAATLAVGLTGAVLCVPLARALR